MLSRRHAWPLAAGAALPGQVLAQAAPDFGDIATNISGQLAPVAVLVTVASFVFGVVMAMTGLMKIRDAANRPNDPSARPHVGVIFIFVGAAMVALPALLSTGVISIFGSGAATTNAHGGFSLIP